MIFTRLRIKNFLSIGKISLNLSRQQMTLVVGRNEDTPAMSSNGSGKSALWDALCWVLYGKTIRPIDVNSIQNAKRSKGVSVSLYLHEGKMDPEWIIARTRGVKASSTLDLFSNGVNVSDRSQQDTQKKIDALIGMDYATFSSSVVFGQQTLRFAQMADKDRKLILERLLGIGVFDKACGLAKQDLAGLRLTLDLSHASHSKAKERIEDLRTRLKEMKERSSKQESESSELIRQNLKNIYTLRKVTKRLSEKLVVVNRKLDRATEECAAVELAQKQTGLVKESYHRIQENILEVEERLRKIRDSKAPSCPMCHQSLPDESGEVVQRKLIKSLKHLSEMASAALLGYKNAKVTVKNGKDALKRKNHLQIRVASLEAKIIDRVESALTLKARNETLKTSGEFTKGSIDEVRKGLAQAKEDVQNASKDVQLLEKQMERRKFWTQAFGHHGIRSYLLDEVIPFLNSRASYYSSILTDGSIRIKFSPTDRLKSGEEVDRLTLATENKNGAKVYEGNSAGERQRIDLAVALSLKDLARARAAKDVNLTVFDEVFESLDETGCEKILDLLNRERENLGTCFVITHNEALKPYFSDHLTVTKANGISRIERNG